ncbi:MAG: hypothetical protein H0Z37_01135 [Firmicutes bacterium]|nr:hypothetical protein [Bacillota bacterium]
MNRLGYELIRDAVDLHVHSGPSHFPRRLDDDELVAALEEAGLRAAVLKAHEGSTAERAYLAQKRASRLRIFGSITLNRFVGGLNPYAVESALALGAKIVWFPTVHAENHLRFYGGAGYREMPRHPQLRLPVEGITVLGEDGRLVEAAQNILELCAERRAVVATGHLHPSETRVLVKEARARGVEHVLVTHPHLPVTRIPLELQKELASLGAWLEHSYLPTTEKWGGFPLETLLYDVKEVGPERCVLQSDLGQVSLPSPADGLAALCEGLVRNGLSETDVRRMIADNPARILGLD